MTGIELRHLRYFVAVAEELHFRRAAERLHMSQPPLSQQIRGLERELGVELFLRTQRRVELTPAGERLLVEARAVLEAVDAAVRATRRVGTGEQGRLAIGFVGSAMYGVLPGVIRAFRSRYPDVDAELREGSTAEQLEALKARRIHVGVVRPPVEEDQLETLTINHERFVVALPAGHELAERRPLHLRDLMHEAFVTLDEREAPGLRAQLKEARKRLGGTTRIVQEAGEMQTLIGLVASGLGIALVPDSVSRLAREDVVYRDLSGWAPTVDLALAWREDDDSPLVRNFVAVARGEATAP
jgi:DNA-binding transcriptional LysR family regulator